MGAMARVAAGVIGMGVATFAGVGAMDDGTVRDDNGQIVESGGLGAFAMQIGDCFNEPDEDLVVSVEGVPCLDFHDAEVYDMVDLPAGPWPGDLAVGQQGWLACEQTFEAYVGRDYATSSLDIGVLTPIESGWATGDREVVCYVFDYNGATLTRSVRGSGI